jgi:hypothetical protein
MNVFFKSKKKCKGKDTRVQERSNCRGLIAAGPILNVGGGRGLWHRSSWIPEPWVVTAIEPKLVETEKVLNGLIRALRDVL